MSQTFPDVPSDHPHAQGIEWAAGQGLVKGKADGTYAPEDPVTRGQLATILWRQAGSPVEEPPPPVVVDPVAPEGVVVYPDTLAAEVAARPAGTTFLLQNGDYRGALPVKDGNWYYGQGESVVFTGGGLSSAPFFHGSQDNVRLSNLTVRYYGPATDRHSSSMIESAGAENWLIEGCDLGYTEKNLVQWGAGWEIRHTRFHHAGKYAMHGGGRKGTKKLGPGVIWEHIADGSGGVPDVSGSDKGGCKFALTKGIVIDGIVVRHIGGNGIWWDISNEDGVLRNFECHDVARAAVNLEVSYGPFTVENGHVHDSGWQIRDSELNWGSAAGVLFSLTPDVYVSGVRVERCPRGIMGIQWNHPQLSNPDHDRSRMGLDNILVEDCVVTDIDASYANNPDRGVVAYDAGFRGGYQSGTRGATSDSQVVYRNCTFDPDARFADGVFV